MTKQRPILFSTSTTGDPLPATSNQPPAPSPKDFTVFFDAVENMRTKQKEYFKTRNVKVLAQAKQLEKEVDAKLEEMKNPYTVP